MSWGRRFCALAVLAIAGLVPVACGGDGDSVADPFGIFPTWEGLVAQGGAAAFVLGSYVVAEQLRKRRRRTILEAAVSTSR